jgi:hypothetical protein
MSIGSPVSGDADVVGGAGTVGWLVPGPAVGGRVGTVGWATFGFGCVAAVVGVTARVVVVVGFGRVVVVVDVDEVVVGAGLTVSTRRKSVPQALPAMRRRTTETVRRGRHLRRVMSAMDGTGSRPRTGGPPGGSRAPTYAPTAPPAP